MIPVACTDVPFWEHEHVHSPCFERARHGHGQIGVKVRVSPTQASQRCGSDAGVDVGE